MALGEVTAYVAGMAASLIAAEEEIKAPPRLQPLIDAHIALGRLADGPLRHADAVRALGRSPTRSSRSRAGPRARRGTRSGSFMAGA